LQILIASVQALATLHGQRTPRDMPEDHERILLPDQYQRGLADLYL
jgi:hypothetical protein